ncbi:hypothetical protein CDAR_219601 [Caerostris darwini]|uniref:Uncharacterized protein n=1 Tax=Caerostris darwini TaxID=1538125 RepID=A0AAV4TH56_9ARAC|nr:hypothetical protein CDAR_219601 [Caerostris darwini]
MYPKTYHLDNPIKLISQPALSILSLHPREISSNLNLITAGSVFKSSNTTLFPMVQKRSRPLNRFLTSIEKAREQETLDPSKYFEYWQTSLVFTKLAKQGEFSGVLQKEREKG